MKHIAPSSHVGLYYKIFDEIFDKTFDPKQNEFVCIVGAWKCSLPRS